MDENAIKARIKSQSAQIQNALKAARLGNPYAAEPDRERRIERLQTKAHLSRPQASAIDNQIDKAVFAAGLAAKGKRSQIADGSVPSDQVSSAVMTSINFLLCSHLLNNIRVGSPSRALVVSSGATVLSNLAYGGCDAC